MQYDTAILLESTVYIQSFQFYKESNFDMSSFLAIDSLFPFCYGMVF
jgi:hypothetical protein